MAKKKENAASEVSGTESQWSVSLDGVPDRIVTAANQEEAVEAFKLASGVISSRFPIVAVKIDAPTVTKVDELQAGPAGNPTESPSPAGDAKETPTVTKVEIPSSPTETDESNGK